ncbi:unnamed protein product [Polarella glacialis]|uniref:Uncharacterized protein n=1 Tax=Polarella glacialis TaxID=89957 RepID=A0A813KDV8_POLGL|nr:unnamed protein product [Polarella glacialis]
MVKGAFAPQALRLLFYCLAAGVCGLVWTAQRFHSDRAKTEHEPEALLLQHRVFAAEVERAWERSHIHEAERRKDQRPAVVSTQGLQRSQATVRAAVPAAASGLAEGATLASKKAKKKRRKEEAEEDIFFVEDDLEAEVVQDLEDFLEHTQLRLALKKTADGLRQSQQKQEDRKKLLEERQQQLLQKAADAKAEAKKPRPPSAKALEPLHAAPKEKALEKEKAEEAAELARGRGGRGRGRGSGTVQAAEQGWAKKCLNMFKHPILIRE